MTEPRKRRWLQLHLSTAVLLMIAASVIVLLNVDGHHPPLSKKQFLHEDFAKPSMGLSAKLLGLSCYGWPYIFYDERHGNLLGYPIDTWLYSALIADIALWAGILISASIICEYFILRRKARRQRGNTCPA